MVHASLPRHTQVREQLRHRIESGELTPGSRLPPETELFKELQASSTTVVRALNDLVREGLIVRRRGSGTFVAERDTPPLIPGRTLKLGILWFQSVELRRWHRFCHRLSLGALQSWGVTGVEPELAADRAQTFTRATWQQPARGLIVECLGGVRSSPDRAPDMERVRKAGYDAILTVGIVEEPWLESLLQLHRSTVIADFPTQRFASLSDLVYADPQSGYRQAVDYFLSQRRRRIHFVGALIGDPATVAVGPGPQETRRLRTRIDPDTFLRCNAWRQALHAQGIDAPESWIHYDTHDAHHISEHLCNLPEADRPQAVVCHGYNQARQIAKTFAEHGLEIEVMGCHIEQHATDSSALSCRLNAFEMGVVAGDLLLARLKNPSRPYLNVGVQMTFAPSADNSDGTAPVADVTAKPDQVSGDQ